MEEKAVRRRESMSRRESMHKKSKYEWKRKHVEEEKVGVEDIACRRRESRSRI